MEDHKPSGLDALANAAILGDMSHPTSTTAVATTTKHPRHRPGCSCIVCIQPPSGKGKHKPTCTCQVCMTVKRRFKTLMMRKKKRQSEREAEIIAQRIQQSTCSPKDETTETGDSSSNNNNMLVGPTSSNVENETKSASELDSKLQSSTLPNNGKGPIDLNSDPDHREGGDALREGGVPRMSMMSLLQVASFPLDTYLKNNGLTSLVSEQERRQEQQQEPRSPSNMLSTPTHPPVHEDCQKPGLDGAEQESSEGDEEKYEAEQEQSERNEE